ncbi:hypothetical protein SCP_0201370 [Sparassis crispa]|uniref:Uncharacterized protein n=1 Tax=Sparassis crispa TaxID=139825 RepID=A0A401G9U4_9APHY|nr:hypothetical protein SCP_0201370 [Sparassis crispa]GBE78940.1 hypothetical protein SCP_0201370 [Sparassis crispa]
MASDAVIDPALLNEEPTRELSITDMIAEFQLTHPSLSPHANAEYSDESSPGLKQEPALPQVEFGQVVKRQRNLSAESEAELAHFMEAPNMIQHFIFNYAVSLEYCDLFFRLSRDSEYQVLDMLKTTLLDYAHSYIFSPTIDSYQSPDNLNNVLG